MTTTVTDFVGVQTRADDLGCTLPSDKLIILPDNFSDASAGDEFRFESEASTITKIFRSARIPCARLTAAAPNEAFIHNRSHDLALPIIYVGSELLKTSPDLISLMVSTLQGYALDLFKGVKSQPSIKAEIIIDDRRLKQSRRVSYEGNVEGLKELGALLKQMTRK